MADHRRKRETAGRKPRAILLAGSIAVLATAGAVSVGLAGADPSPAPTETFLARAASAEATLPGAATAPSTRPSAATASVDPLDKRVPAVSRGLSRATPPRAAPRVSHVEKMLRPKVVARVVDRADTDRWTTTKLNLWTEPGKSAAQDGLLDVSKKVVSTGRSLYGRDEIVTGPRQTRWVTSGYLSADKPTPAPTASTASTASTSGLSDAPCPDTGVEYRLTDYAVHVYRAVCHAFPQIATYGGYDAHGEHASGKALDIMTTDPALLTTIGDFLQAHAAELHLYDIIRLQQIWTPVRASEGWRAMPDRGSATANHYDHVHVSTY